ncbi:MAG TPA: cupredoxin domain-containing protein [Acidimicrobiales bacterium]|nr:cupredoxin domain-containing protein [Acidimicrobiales bacterium]
MSRSRIVLPIAVASVFVAVLAAGHAFADTSSHTITGANTVLGPQDTTVEVTIHHSHFTPDAFTVQTGTAVRFVIHNEDPIDHEFIVGDAEVHRRHEAGTEKVHPPRPGEVSIAAGTTAETTFRFEGTTGSGTVIFACHLPGHFRFGMSGTVAVVSS